MPVKKPRTKEAPHRVWVVVDALTGLPIMVLKDPDKVELLEDETCYEYELRRQYGKA
jgi:hypothetical protein